MLRKKAELFVLALICLTFSARAQVYINPFTQYGLGELLPPVQVARMGMGGTAYTETDPNRYNFANPATYAQMHYFSFDMGATGLYYQHTGDNLTFKNIDASVPYLSFAFPIDSARQWGFSAGLMPYSQISYELQSDVTDLGMNKQINQTGYGGLTKFYVGSGIKVCKNFYAGVNASYIFGNMNATQTQVFPDTGTFYGIHQNIQNVTGGFLFDAGLAYNINFRIPEHYDKQLNDSIYEIRQQLRNNIIQLPKPVSPYRNLDRPLLKLELAYNKSKDSLNAIKISKDEQKAKLKKLKDDYQAQRKAVKASITADTLAAYKNRLKEYHANIKAMEERSKQREISQKENRQGVYSKGLNECETKTSRYLDSIKTVLNKDAIEKYHTKKMSLEKAMKKAKADFMAVHRHDSIKVSANESEKVRAYKDSLKTIYNPFNRYKTLRESGNNICSDYRQYRKYTLQIGGDFNMPTYLPNTQTIDAYTYSDRLLLSDSIAHFVNSKSPIYMPMGIGASLELKSDRNWRIAVSGEYRQWSKFSGVGISDSLKDYYSLGIGAQYTPPKKQFGNNAFTTGNYRIGFRYAQMPYIVNNAPVTDMRLTLGMGIPIAQRDLRFLNRYAENNPKNWPYVDLALTLGQTGNYSINRLQQQYVMLSIGLHIFEVNWFIKKKLE